MADSTSPRVWFITGSSTGFGHLLAKELLRRGERVIATARDVSKLEDLTRLSPVISARSRSTSPNPPRLNRSCRKPLPHSVMLMFS